MLVMVVLSMAAVVPAPKPPPFLPPQPAMFSGVFDDNMVLQRAPAKAAVFGTTSNFTSEATAAKVTVEVTSADQFTGELHASKTYTANVAEDGSWKVLLDAAEAGGAYTITCACTSGCVNSTVGGRIRNVTFGEVYFCSGQSNMELLLHFTFSRNDTLDAIAQGKYQNIRVRQFPHHPMPEPTYTVKPMGALYPNASTWLGAGQALTMEVPFKTCYKCGMQNRSVLLTFSAACWYFGQALSDELAKMNNGDAPPIGLIASSVGGTMIELWTPAEELQNCKNTSCGPKINTTICGTLYNGMVAPFINMTVKGFLWYQGENNVFAETGNSMEGTGYGCMLPTMINYWRKMWSVVEGTTDPMAGFGVYTLAAGTSEGHGTKMGAFRWSQTGNYGTVPNPVMPNCFVASGYDLGDPWGKGCGKFNCCCYYGRINPEPPCSGDTRWSCSQTHFFMGPIHPRPKLPFATRLARAAAVVVYGAEGPATGPVISGCSVSGKSLTIRFNATLLTSSEKVIVQDYNTSLEVRASGMEVCGHEVDPPIVPLNNKDKNWTNANIKLGANGDSIVVDLSPLNGTAPTAVRYAWDDYPCCGTVDRDLKPCPPGSCPVMSSPSMLPAMPFFALIQDGKCKCIPPQVCDG